MVCFLSDSVALLNNNKYKDKNMDITNITGKTIFITCALLFKYCDSTNEHWCPMQCECYNDFETADCSRRMLAHLPLFSNLTKRIYAENNNIQGITYNDLGNLNHLLVLNLQNNSLSEVHFTAFCGFKNIIEINLSRNKINSLFTDVMKSQSCQLRRFSRLHLSYNKIKLIPQNLSNTAPNLEVLNLAYNEIHSIKLDEDFTRLHSLRSLDLSGNPIHEVNSGDLLPLMYLALESFRVSECAIYNLSGDAFKSLSNVTSLSLSRNLIYPKTLKDAFKSLSNESRLQHLDLSEMMLSNVTNAMLNGFKNLISLDISFSSVRYIQPQLFASLNTLDIINLEGNFLSKLDGINKVQSLRKLFLRDNRLRWINLTGLDCLELVDLSGNLIMSLPQNWLAGIETLHFLNISNNVISTINHRAFQKVTLNTLDLSHNKLIYFHRYGLFKVQNLYLSHNQITRLTDNAFDNLEPVLEKLDLSYNQFDEFSLLIERDFLALQRLNLRHNKLGDALARGHLEQLLKSLTHLQVLDLSHNQIKSIPFYQIRNLHHLTTLILEGNKITYLEDLGIYELSSLAKLVVSDNDIQTVDANMLDEMDYLEEIDLSLNPFDCSCSILPFQKWLNTTLIMILNSDQDKYVCDTPARVNGVNVQTVHPNPHDCLRTTQLTLKLKLQIMGAVFATFTTFVLLGIVVIYYSRLCTQIRTLQYKWQVRYREVSSVGAEFGGESAENDQQDTEYLTVENVYSNDVTT